MVVSPEFPVFTIDTNEVLPEIIDIYFRTPSVWPELAGISGGTNVRRRRLQPSAFLNYEMPVPPMPTQLKIREMYQRIQTLKASHVAIRKANQALIPATLERCFHPRTIKMADTTLRSSLFEEDYLLRELGSVAHVP